MNIQSDFQNLPQIRGAEKVSELGQRAANQGTAEVNVEGDKADLSAASVAISQSSALSDVRMEKVVAIQAALGDGSYQVSSEDVAAKLIEHMQANQS